MTYTPQPFTDPEILALVERAKQQQEEAGSVRWWLKASLESRAIAWDIDQAQAAWCALAEEPQGNVVLTARAVALARGLILECTGTDLLSGDRPAKKEDRVWVYRRLCEAAFILLGELQGLNHDHT